MMQNRTFWIVSSRCYVASIKLISLSTMIYIIRQKTEPSADRLMTLIGRSFIRIFLMHKMHSIRHTGILLIMWICTYENKRIICIPNVDNVIVRPFDSDQRDSLLYSTLWCQLCLKLFHEHRISQHIHYSPKFCFMPWKVWSENSKQKY